MLRCVKMLRCVSLKTHRKDKKGLTSDGRKPRAGDSISGSVSPCISSSSSWEEHSLAVLLNDVPRSCPIAPESLEEASTTNNPDEDLFRGP